VNVAHLLVGQAGERASVTAIIEGSGPRARSLTFSDLEARSASAAALLTRRGIARGHHVLVFVPMSIDLYVALIALFRIGAVATFLDPSAGRQHIARCCEMIPPKAMIAIRRAHLLRLTTPALRRIPIAFSVGGWVPFAHGWRIAANANAPSPIVAVEAEAPALVTFTSGSTGQPKAAVRSHAFLAAQHAALAPAIDLAPGQVDLATLPIFTLANLASGVTSVIPDADLRRVGAVQPRPILRQIREHRVTRCVASPAFFERLLSHADARDGLHGIRRIDTGGAPVFPGLLRRLQEAMPQAQVCAVYGSTEAEPIAHIEWRQMSPADIDAMLAGRGLLAGPPAPQISLRIIPNQWGRPIEPMSAAAFAAMHLPADAPGEIVVHGQHVLSGYLHGQGDAETKFRVDGQIWHRTGDAGYLDACGRLWLLGRAQAQITDAHGTIYPFAVECAASAVPGVRRSALVQHDSQRLLVVEPTDDAPADLPEQLLAPLAWAMVHEVRLMTPIPVDPRHNAKIDYLALHARLQATAARGH
jgi:olefin beta-lactone synthetase